MHYHLKLIAFFLAGLCVSFVLYLVYLSFFGTIIYRTPFGFFPSTISVPVGTMVTFKNISGDIAWPASDQHPDHTVYRDFDARKALEPGESWSFTFTQQGVWNYHDHVSAQLIGQVIVRGADGDTAFDCVGEAPTACWAAEIDEALRTKGVSAAYQVLRRIHTEYPSFATHCHGFTHDIGLKTYLYYGKDVSFDGETSYCNAGFYHGFLEGMINDASQVSEVNAFCESVGERLGSEFPIAQSQCIHGIGHGLIEYFMHTRPELIAFPRELLSEVFPICAGLSLSEGHDDEMRCVSGAFDVYKGFVVINDTFEFSESDPGSLAVCRELERDIHKRACYWQMSRLFTRAHHIEPFLDEIARTGSSSRYYYEKIVAPEEQDEYLGLVTRSWALFIGKRAVYDYPIDIITKACDQVPSGVVMDCIRGLAEGAFLSSQSNFEYERLNLLCGDAAFTLAQQKHCYHVFQIYLFEHYSKAETDRQCREIPEMYYSPGYCGSGLT